MCATLQAMLVVVSVFAIKRQQKKEAAAHEATLLGAHSPADDNTPPRPSRLVLDAVSDTTESTHLLSKASSSFQVGIKRRSPPHTAAAGMKKRSPGAAWEVPPTTPSLLC